MTKRAQPRTPITLTSEALFRHHVVSQVHAHVLRGENLATAIRRVAASQHADLDGSLRDVSERSVYRWCAAFSEGGRAALEPAPRPHTESSEVLPAAFLEFLRNEHEVDFKASVPELIRRARARGVIAPTMPIDRTTVFRACKRMGLSIGRRSTKRDADMRRFAYPHRMMMVLSDGKHFRAGIRRSRRVALFFLDDATRRALGVRVATSEHTEAFLRGTFDLVMRHGLMDVLFLDRGPGFASDDTHATIARLPAAFVHGQARYPEGHGKIERFHQTAWSGVLRGLAGRVEIDDGCDALTLRIGHWLEHVYNHTPHESLGPGETPAARWDRDTRALRFPESEASLRERFLLTETRAVSNDNVVSIDGVDYEVPRGHARTRIPVMRQVLDGTLWIQGDERLVQLHPVDLALNATSHRGHHRTREEPAETTPITAAETLFNNEFGSVVDRDGGYLPTSKDRP
jgi:transposase InsO family protein